MADSALAEAGGATIVHTAIVDAPIDIAALAARVAGDDKGATSMFIGTVRNVNEGRAVTGIQYDAYRAMAELELQRIANEVATATPGVSIAIEHRLGMLGLGDVSVAIAAAHPRRAPAIECARTLIELLKQRVPIWKLEHYEDGERRWVDAGGNSDGVPK